MVDGIDSTGGYALYYASRASMPNAGLDANGNIWLIFSGYTENIDNGAQVYEPYMQQNQKMEDLHGNHQ